MAAGVLGISQARDRHDLAGILPDSDVTGAIASSEPVDDGTTDNQDLVGDHRR
ncbi:hypothetical protein [Bradyrhizobium genomosp. I (2014)]|uniref:hypothetical protein n=1 Tax=Bradyrhizobium genomosp. I (2014) TaxID=2683269 RepID=UPI001FCCB7A3|nr:hypothetical protein [Bradyrhizobium sp. CCBAU 43298]